MCISWTIKGLILLFYSLPSDLTFSHQNTYYMVVTMNTSTFIYYEHWLTNYAVLLSDPTVICRCKVAKSDYQLCHMHLSVHLHGTIQFPLDRFLLNLVLGTFLKIPAWLKSYENTGHFTWRYKYILLTATYVVQKYITEHTIVLLWQHSVFYIADSALCSSSSRWRYSPGWALASSTMCLQASRFLALSLHSFTPIFLRSMDMSSNHLIFGLPLRLVACSLPPSSSLAAA